MRTSQACLTPTLDTEIFLKTIIPSRKAHQATAEATLKKDQRLDIRISSRDLKSLQARAVEEGIPYQTLAASLLHKYVNGHLVSQR